MWAELAWVSDDWPRSSHRGLRVHLVSDDGLCHGLSAGAWGTGGQGPTCTLHAPGHQEAQAVLLCQPGTHRLTSVWHVQGSVCGWRQACNDVVFLQVHNHKAQVCLPGTETWDWVLLQRAWHSGETICMAPWPTTGLTAGTRVLGWARRWMSWCDHGSARSHLARKTAGRWQNWGWSWVHLTSDGMLVPAGHSVWWLTLPMAAQCHLLCVPIIKLIWDGR